MTFSKTDNGYLIRLFKGEKIVESLQKFCKKESLVSGSLTAIGGASDIELGYYNLETKQYQWKTFQEVHEIVSLTGNISLVENEPFLHIHTVISNNNFETFGGHLKEATVSATCEVILTNLNAETGREMDDEIGLRLLKLESQS